MLGRTEQVSGTQLRLHGARRLRYSITAKKAAKSVLVAPSHLAQGMESAQSTSSSGGSWVARGPGLPVRSTLGGSSTWTLKEEYSFSSGPRLGSEAKELLGLMARSTELAENGSLSSWDTSTPGLLISGSGRLRPAVTVVAAASRVSLARLLLLSDGIMLAGGLAIVAGTLDATVPAYTELMGNFDGATLVDGVEAVGFGLIGNLEDTLEGVVFTGTDLVEEGTELAVTELVGTASLVPRQVAPLASPSPIAKADPVEEEDKEVSGDGTDTVTPGKWTVRRVVRGRGWKETVGDTGPCIGTGLETVFAAQVPASSGSCSLEDEELRACRLGEDITEPPDVLGMNPELACGVCSEFSTGDFGGWVSWTGLG